MVVSSSSESRQRACGCGIGRENKIGGSNNALVLFLLLVNVADLLGELLQGILVGAVLQLKICESPVSLRT